MSSNSDWGKQGKLPVKYFCSTKPLFVSVVFHGDHRTAYRDGVKSCHPQFWDIAGFNIVLSVGLDSK